MTKTICDICKDETTVAGPGFHQFFDFHLCPACHKWLWRIIRERQEELARKGAAQ